MGEAHKNNVPSFKRFLEKFCGVIEKRTDEDDDLPIRLAPSYLVESEIEGETLDWILQYLASNKCPIVLATSLARSTCDELLAIDLTELYEEEESFETEEADLHEQKRVPQIECRRLAKVAFSQLFKVCERWNCELPEIPVPERMYEVYAHAIKNTRRKMEDRHVILHDLNSLFKLKDYPSQSYFAVFDGHGGVEAAIYTASHLHCHMVKHPKFEDDVHTAIRESYRNTDNNFIEKAQREGLRSGSTCVTALIRGQTLHLAWLGDSQAVLVKDGQVHEMMNPHKPEREDEKKRIEDLGGVVVWFGTWRVNGNIAVSRAIGDIEHKPYISGEPDILSVELDGTEDYLILGCDGVWDTLPKDELPEIMYTYLQECEGDRTMVAQRLVSIARDNGSTDNISVVIVFFKDQISEPKPMRAIIEEAKQSEMDDEKKGDNFDGKENTEGDISPNGPSGGLGSIENNTESMKKCYGVPSDKQNSSRRSRRDGNNNTKDSKGRMKTRSKSSRKKRGNVATEPVTESSSEVSRKPLKSSSQVNTSQPKKARSKSSTSRNRKVKPKSDTKETVWAFTGKSEGSSRVQNHRLNHRAQASRRPAQTNLTPSNSYMSKDWLAKTMTRIMQKRQEGQGHPTQVKAPQMEESPAEAAIPWYAQEQDEDEDTGDLVAGSVLVGNKSTLHQSQDQSSLAVSGLVHQRELKYRTPTLGILSKTYYNSR